MTGKQLKNRIAGTGHNIKEVAELIGIPRANLSQALSAQDVKTGLVEKVSAALNVPITYFFDMAPGTSGNAVASGSYSAASIHGNASVSADGEDVLKERIKMLEQLLDEKERTIKILMSK